MKKDYYKILGIEKNVTVEELKRTYKKLAKKYHPDLNPGEANQEKMKEINEAFVFVMEELKITKSGNLTNNNKEINDEDFSPFTEFGNIERKYDYKMQNPDCFNFDDVYIGNLYKYVYKTTYDYFEGFEDQTRLICVKKNAKLLRVGVFEYIDISNIIVKILFNKMGNKFPFSKYIIRTDFFKPFADQIFVSDLRKYDVENKQENQYRKILRKNN